MSPPRRRLLPPAEGQVVSEGRPILADPRAPYSCPGEWVMTGEERSELCLAFARVLYVNGQATDQVVAVIGRLANKLGISAELLPRWGELQLRVESGGATQTSYVASDP